jgi:hypothetical protein
VVFPLERPAIYLTLGQDAPPAPTPLAEREKLLGFPGQDWVSVDVVPARTRAEAAALPAHRIDWPSTTGLTLLGYDPPTPEGRMETYWLVESLADERDQWLYAPFVHLTDRQGRQVANVGGLGLPGYVYRLGDVYRVSLKLPPLPAGTYRLDIGQFDGVHGRGALFLSPAGPAVEFYSDTLVGP